MPKKYNTIEEAKQAKRKQDIEGVKRGTEAKRQIVDLKKLVLKLLEFSKLDPELEIVVLEIKKILDRNDPYLKKYKK